MLFAIRDDDLNYFSRPETLEETYRSIWQDCPVSFSAVPFHACTVTGAIPEQYWHGDEVYPVGNNRELVAYIRDGIRHKRISITLHGYSHKDNPDGYEFETGTELRRKVREGQQYLALLFDQPIRVFVPPHNSISRAGLKAVIAHHLHLGSIVSVRHQVKRWAPSVLVPTIKKKLFETRYKGFSYPYVLDYGSHKEIRCHGLTPKTHLDDLLRKLRFCHERQGVFVLASHYWEYEAPCSNHSGWKMRDLLFRFWDEVIKLPNVKYVSLNAGFDVF